MTDGRTIQPSQVLLRVRDLTVRYQTSDGPLTAVDSISFEVGRGEILGLVGESGSGKSATALSIARLLPEGAAEVTAEEITLDGVDLSRISAGEMRRVQGGRIGFIFQDPMSSLNPLMPVGEQIWESMRQHLGLGKKESRDRTIELLARVGIPNPSTRVAGYPHQFSGGMRQRVMIAMALACEPVLILADEPTTSLDVTIQAQILEILRDLADATGVAVLLITHDLGIAARMCDRVSVMYAGQLVETGPIDELFPNPRMPYTVGLLQSIPRIDRPSSASLDAIKGFPPRGARTLPGCSFVPRCPYARDVCSSSPPALSARGPGHLARCYGTEAGGWISWSQ